MALRANPETTKLIPSIPESDTAKSLPSIPCLDIRRISELLLSLFQSQETPSDVLQKFIVASRSSYDLDLKSTAVKVESTVSTELKSSTIPDDASKLPNPLATKDVEEITTETVLVIPSEIWATVFSFLDDLSTPRLTCRSWNSLILQYPLTCTKLFQKAFGCNPNPNKGPIVTQFRNVQFNIEEQIYSELDPIVFNPNFRDKTVSLLSGNHLLLCHSEDEIVRQLWDISESVPKTMQAISLPKDLNTLLCLNILFNTSHLLNSDEIIYTLTTNNCNSIIIFDLATNKSRTLFDLSHKSVPTCLDYKQNAKKRFVAIGFEDGKCEIWDLATRLRVRDFQFDAAISSVCLDIAKGRLAVGFKHGLVEVWDTKTNPDAPLGKYEMFHAPVKHLCIQGNIIAAGSKAEQAQEDEIILMPMHPPKNVNSISLPEIAWIAFQGTQLVIIHGNPLQIRRLDFSVSDEEFFQNLNLQPHSPKDERKLELLQSRFDQLPKNQQEEIYKVYRQKDIEHKNPVEQRESMGDDHECGEAAEELIHAINTYYCNSAKLST